MNSGYLKLTFAKARRRDSATAFVGKSPKGLRMKKVASASQAPIDLSLSLSKLKLEDTIEEEKEMLDPEDTYFSIDTIQEKSTAEDDQIYESFTMPEIDEFQLDFRNKLISRENSDHNQIRRRFLHKLTQEKIWLLPKEKPASSQTCIIFDWDDTLLWTSFLNPNGYATNEPIPESYYPLLVNLESIVYKILTASIKNGKVFIITNAADGWVEFSSRKYMPSVFDLLKDLTVISARTNYEPLYPGNTFEW